MKKKSPTPAASQKAATVATLRVECVSGPWLDEKCVRFIQVKDGANLYDLHLAILNSVKFDEEFEFHFFTALSPDAARTLVPDDADDIEPEDIDPDIYEELPVLDYAKPKAKSFLHYVFGSEHDDWVFEIRHTGITSPAVPDEFYPLVMEQYSEGPDPEQYGSGFDDFSEDSKDFMPPPRTFDDEDENDDFAADDGDEDDFFGDDDEEDDDDDDASYRNDRRRSFSNDDDEW